jgi:hypothetical protein
VTEVAARVGKVRTRKAAPANEASAHTPTAKASAHVTAAKATAYMAAAEATAHVAAAAAEPATVSTTASATATTPARKCISGQSPCESRSHSQNNHGFAYHLTAPSTRLRVHRFHNSHSSRCSAFLRLLCAASCNVTI